MEKVQARVEVYDDANVIALIADSRAVEAGMPTMRIVNKTVLEAMRETCPDKPNCSAQNTATSKTVIDELGAVVVSVGFTCANGKACDHLRPVSASDIW